MKKLILILAVAMLLVGCKKEQGLILSDSEISMHYDEQKQLTVSFLDEEMEYSVKSSNENVAKIDNNGTVHGVSIGTATITVTSNDGKYIEECKVLIMPYYILYKNLCLNFHCSKQNVKDFETRELERETEIALVYNGEFVYIWQVGYIFENGLNGSVIFIENYLSKELVTFLNERYESLGMDEEYIYYRTYDEKALIALGVSDNFKYLVMYMEFPEEKVLKNNDFKQLFNKLNNKMQ